MVSDSARGQATVELLAWLPAILLAGVLCLPLMATGYSLTLADGAAEAGAIALASGEQAQPAVQAALPGWATERIDLDVVGGRVTVRLRPPTLIEPLARALEVSSSAWIRRPEASG